MKKLFVVLGIFLSFTGVLAFAEFHSSITKVDYNEDSRILSFTTKINVTDLSQSINIDPGDPNFGDVAKRYVESNFVVSVNDSFIKLSFTDCKINAHTVWVYFESTDVDNISKIKVRNTILLNEFSNQKNLVIISYKGNQKTLSLQRGNEMGETNF